MNVWTGIVQSHPVGAHLLALRFNGSRYLWFIQDVLPELLDIISHIVCNRMWLQHDVGPTYFNVDVWITDTLIF